MPAANPQYYLIKNAKNISFFFYLDKHKILNYKVFSPENLLISTEQLLPEAIVDFSALIDPKDQIHLICATKEGSLLYFIHHQTKWEHKLIAKLDFKSNTYKHLTLIQRKDFTHIICNKTNLLNPMITSLEHMYWNEKNFNKGTISTYIPGKYHAPFQVDIDSMSNVHLIYKVLHRNNHQLTYCRFNMFNKKWSTGEIISNLQEDNSHPFMLIDKKDNLHLTWCTIVDNNFTLKYRRRPNITNQKSKWSQIAELSNKNTNHLSPILLQEGNTIKLFSRQNGYINTIISENYGVNWSPVSKVNSFKLENASLIRYYSNYEGEKSYYTLPIVYGEVNDCISILGSRLYCQKDINPIDNISERVITSSTLPKLEKLPEEEKEPKEAMAFEDVKAIEDVEAVGENEMFEENSQEEAIPQHIVVDSDLKLMIQGVQSYLNKMVLELERLEGTNNTIQDILQENKLEISKELEVNLPKEGQNNDLFNQLKSLDYNLNNLEDEQMKLEYELGELHKKIYSIEERLIAYKKQFMELEEQTYQSIQSNSSIVNRVINFFR